MKNLFVSTTFYLGITLAQVLPTFHFSDYDILSWLPHL